MLGLIKCRICDEDIDVYDAERVIIHYSTCAECKDMDSRADGSGGDLFFQNEWKDA